MNSGRKALLELRGVRRRYTQGESVIDVLRNASLSISGGEMTALVGPPVPANRPFSTSPACWKGQAGARCLSMARRQARSQTAGAGACGPGMSVSCFSSIAFFPNSRRLRTS